MNRDNYSGMTQEWLRNDSETTPEQLWNHYWNDSLCNDFVTKNFVILQAGGKASKYGSYKCDSPRILVESAFKAMKTLVPDPEFILWTGDSDPKSIIWFRNSTFSIFQHQNVSKFFWWLSQINLFFIMFSWWFLGHFSCQH